MNKFIEISFLLNLPKIGPGKVCNSFLDYLKEDYSLEQLKDYIADTDESLVPYFKDAEKLATNSYNEAKEDINFDVLTIFDEGFPKSLLELNSKTLYLYIKGNKKILDLPNISFIGTRNPSVWASKVEEAIVQRTIDYSNRVIVSGLALGCDKISHEVAVKNSHPTIAVLPSGFNQIAPKQNTNLAKAIINTGGCLISTYSPKTIAKPYYFNERDKIVAELSDGVFVVQADADSGTIYTAKTAYKYNKPIACNVAYGSDCVYSGNDLLINEYNAFPASNKESLITFLDSLNVNAKPMKQTSLFDTGMI